MKADAFRAALRSMPVVAPEVFLEQTGPLLILAPHPDDETLGAGGLMAAAAASGRAPSVLVLTDGAGSHPGSKRYDKERLTALREAESAEAAARLGMPDGALRHLRQPDTALASSGPIFEDLCTTVAGEIDRVGARSVLVTWDKDPHCDHEAAAALARALRLRNPDLALWFYPVWGWHLEADEPVDAPAPDGFRLDIEGWQRRKREAIAAHASQMTDLIDDDPDGFRFTPEKLAPFLDRYEYVFRVP
jgi:LmbE family N-acetylglucosaminyl deacetylase